LIFAALITKCYKTKKFNRLHCYFLAFWILWKYFLLLCTFICVI
jgi:hypothetical protein